MRRFAAFPLLALFVVVCLTVASAVYPVGYSGRGSKAEIDGTTNALRIIEYEHHEIHSGASFTVDYSETTANSDDDRTIIGLTTPDTARWVHVIITITAVEAAEFLIYEAPTFTAGEGTDQAIYNRNRNSATTSTVLNQDATPEVAKVTTYDETEAVGLDYSGGTLVEYVLLSAGSGPRQVGGTSRGSQEWVLKQDTSYLFILQNVGASVNTHVINLSWYEHQNR